MSLSQNILNGGLKESKRTGRTISASKRQFHMSHEIRTPMNGIIGSAEFWRGIF
jgi:signal transduction histidine kinase